MARDEAGLTQEQLAEKVDRTKEAISNIERGINLPTIETLDRICSVLGLPLKDAFGDREGSPGRIGALARIDRSLMKMTDFNVLLSAEIIAAILSSRPNEPTE